VFFAGHQMRIVRCDMELLGMQFYEEDELTCVDACYRRLNVNYAVL